MPVCVLETNLSEDQVPADLHVKFAQVIADVLNKPLDRITVTLHTGLRMCRAGSTEPCLAVHLYSINVFDAERSPKYSPKFFEFFHAELPSMPGKRISMLFHPLEAHQPQSAP